jgi:hypothetical protein
VEEKKEGTPMSISSLFSAVRGVVTPRRRPSGPVSAKNPVVYKVKADDVYVRTHAMGLVKGTLHRGDEFVAEYVSDKGWAWGYAEGHVDKKGWMPLGSGKKANVKRTNERPPSDWHSQGAPHNLAKGHIHYSHHKPYTQKAKVKPGHTVTMYGNWSPTKGPSDKVMTLGDKDHVNLRYKLNKHWGVAFRDVKGDRPRWGFVRLDDIQLPSK